MGKSKTSTRPQEAPLFGSGEAVRLMVRGLPDRLAETAVAVGVGVGNGVCVGDGVAVTVGRMVALGCGVLVAEGEGDGRLASPSPSVGVDAVFPHPMSMVSRKTASKSCFLEESMKRIRLGYWRLEIGDWRSTESPISNLSYLFN